MGFWKAKAPEEGSQPSSDGWSHADAQSDKTYPPPSSISKPFNSMSVEELLDALPSCTPEAVTQIWVPVMRRKNATLSHIQSTQEQLLDSYTRLKTMDRNLEDIAQDVKRIPLMYEEVVRSTGVVSEVAATTFKKQIDDAETKLADVEAANDHLRAEADLQSTAASAAKYNTYALVDSIRPVLEQALLNPQSWDPIQCETMHRLLQDFPDDYRQSSVPHLRIPQNDYKELLSNLGDAKDTIIALRSLAAEQAQMIKDQSDKLTDDLDRYEHVVDSLKTRNHEVLLLDNRNKVLEDQLHAHEVALEQSKQDGAHIAILHDQLTRSKQQYEARLEEKESELVKMRQEFERVEKQLLVAQVDLRNARTSQALASGDNGFNKPRPSLPSSYSSFALNVRQLTEQSEPRKPQQTYRIQGPRPGLAKPHQAAVVLTQSPSATRSLAQPVRPRRLSDPFEDTYEGGRPRAASWDSEKVMVFRPNDGAKPLPIPPTISPTIRTVPTLGHQADVGAAADAPDDIPRPSPQFHMRDLHRPETPGSGKRILSIIAEASQEGSSSQKTLSATSSEKYDYRNSISALDMLNSQSSPFDHSPESPVMHASWADVHRRHDPRSASSRDLNVSKMCHHDRQHL